MEAKKYSLASQGDLKLSRNFIVREFACKDGSDTVIIHPMLVEALQAVRDHFAAPVRILSGYRTPDYNRKVGGVKDSQHLLGKAADIVVADHTPVQVYRAINNGWVREIDPQKIGLGLYVRQGFVHIDVRGEIARW